jgi:large subunit ribosomal protein L30
VACRLKTSSTDRRRTVMSEKKTVTVKLVRSVIGTRQDHRDTVRGLGLRRLNSTAVLEDTAAVRGMINKVSYLIQVI